MSKKNYPGINIQWPISELILNGKKTIETRAYPIPAHYLNREILLIETPGKNGNFKARIRGIILFSGCFEYKSKKQFYSDVSFHFVTKNSQWAWVEKNKWGWKLKVLDVFTTPIPAPQKKGIVYTSDIKLHLTNFGKPRLLL